MTTRFASRMKHVKPSAIRELLRFGADPSIISFGGGYPDATLFPLEQLEAVFSRSILEHGHDTLQYTVSDGPPHLRAQIAARMANEGVSCTKDNILILQGGQQGLDLVAKLLVDRGDVIITEDPTFLGGLIAFNPCEPTYACVGMDDEGMDTDALERATAVHRRRRRGRCLGQHRSPRATTLEATAADATLLADIPVGQQAQVQTASLTQQADAQATAADATAKKSAEEAARIAGRQDRQGEEGSRRGEGRAGRARGRREEQAPAATAVRDAPSFPAQGSYTVAEVQAMARQMVPADQFQCFSNIVDHESTWNYQARRTPPPARTVSSRRCPAPRWPRPAPTGRPTRPPRSSGASTT